MSLYSLYQRPGMLVLGFIVVMLWVIVWKGLALWFSAKNQQKGWFIALLIFNTLGLLPIIYLIWFRPSTPKKETKKEEKVDEKKSTS